MCISLNVKASTFVFSGFGVQWIDTIVMDAVSRITDEVWAKTFRSFFNFQQTLKAFVFFQSENILGDVHILREKKNKNPFNLQSFKFLNSGFLHDFTWLLTWYLVVYFQTL